MEAASYIIQFDMCAKQLLCYFKLLLFGYYALSYFDSPAVCCYWKLIIMQLSHWLCNQHSPSPATHIVTSEAAGKNSNQTGEADDLINTISARVRKATKRQQQHFYANPLSPAACTLCRDMTCGGISRKLNPSAHSNELPQFCIEVYASLRTPFFLV